MALAVGPSSAELRQYRQTREAALALVFVHRHLDGQRFWKQPMTCAPSEVWALFQAEMHDQGELLSFTVLRFSERGDRL